ncbi:MAG: methyltransferase domain-containing protein [Polyangiaceae bacterium]
MLTDEYFDRFQTRKYRARNPLKRMLIKRFVRAMHGLFLEAGPVRSVLEVGVGEGFLSGYLSEKLPEVEMWGVDILESDLRLLSEKFPRIKAQQGSIYDLGALGRTFDLVVCAEVLEHLERPEEAVAELSRVARRALVSVPHEPWFMLSNLASGKNVTRLGNDVEHINHFSPRSLSKLLSGSFTVDAVETSYPFILALATPRAQ